MRPHQRQLRLECERVRADNFDDILFVARQRGRIRPTSRTSATRAARVSNWPSTAVSIRQPQPNPYVSRPTYRSSETVQRQRQQQQQQRGGAGAGRQHRRAARRPPAADPAPHPQAACRLAGRGASFAGRACRACRPASPRQREQPAPGRRRALPRAGRAAGYAVFASARAIADTAAGIAVRAGEQPVRLPLRHGGATRRMPSAPMAVRRAAVPGGGHRVPAAALDLRRCSGSAQFSGSGRGWTSTVVGRDRWIDPTPGVITPWRSARCTSAAEVATSTSP